MNALQDSSLRSKAPSRPLIRNARRGGRSVGGRSSITPNSDRALSSRIDRKDWNLIQQAVRGDLRAQDELFATHAARLYRTAFSVLRNREDAEDAVQNSLCRAFVNLRSFQGRSSFATWLTRIVINSALMILRKNRKLHEVSIDPLETDAVPSILQLPDTSLNPEERFQLRERNKAVNQAVCCLRPKIRAVVELGQLQDLSLKETAQELGISVETAKGRLFHARAALRKSASLRGIAKATVEPARQGETR